MKITARVAPCLFLAAVSSLAQEIMGGSATIGNVSLIFEMRLEPSGDPAAAAAFGESGVIVGNGVAHRYVAHRTTRKYLGYDAIVRDNPGGGFSLELRPLSLDAKRLGLSSPETWSAWPPPRYHAPPVVRHGDKLEFALMTGGGQQLIERVMIKADGKPPVVRPVTPPRDFRLEDAELELADGELRINGTKLDLAGGGGMRGNPLWMYLEGRGRYVFTLLPRLDLGFVKAGEVRGQEMTFRIGADQFSIRGSSQIAPGGGAYHLYVFHDPGYRPQGSNSPYVWGAGGTLESLSRRR